MAWADPSASPPIAAERDPPAVIGAAATPADAAIGTAPGPPPSKCCTLCRKLGSALQIGLASFLLAVVYVIFVLSVRGPVGCVAYSLSWRPCGQC